MSVERHIEATLYFLTSDEGGRGTAVSTGYRGQFYFDNIDVDAQHEYPDVESVQPGDTVRGYFRFYRPEAHLPKMHIGKEFLIREGIRVIAKGVVTRVFNLNSFKAS
ncbi:elongation factor Tu [Hyphomicrobium facile]|uniref:Elongation factor Tu C-terminal domain-containing protein n=1 Tax=Hyphomicrobium facile TaxID=51670 RepID=A0A1I7NB52_9HYPH|nr:elongation factor Tu [Hyphomicrobium facile]SFV31878.1 Elongation factor Tu C-terminal domain-containing protein [Hyphomicrobium facile]